VIDPKKNETILDPACGTAGFLISSYKHILKHNSSNYDPEADKPVYDEKVASLSELTLNSKKYKGDKLTPDERSQLAKNISGYDISPDMVRLSLVNMYLHGLNDPDITEYDTLTSLDNWNQYADVILANPPFMSPKGGIRPHNRFTITSSRSEVLFVDYMAEHLTPNGRVAVIVPEGIIFQSGTAYKQLRKLLVDEYLVGVISLPAGVFNPYSGVKTSILWLDKSLAKKTDSILFVKIENDGFDLGAQRRPIKQNDLPNALEVIKTYKNSLTTPPVGHPFLPGGEFNNNSKNSSPFEGEVSEGRRGQVQLVTKKQIAENEDYNLSGERFKEQIVVDSIYELEKLENICTIGSGGTPSRKEDSYWNGEIPWVGSAVCKDSVVNKSVEFITNKGLKNSAAKLFQKETTLLALVGATIGKTGFLMFDCTTNQNVAGLYPIDTAKLNTKYLFFALQKLYPHFMRLGSGKFRMANLSFVRNLKIPLPPLSVQEEIVAEIEGYQKIIDGARQVVDNYKPQIKIDPEWEMVELGKVLTFVSSGSTPKGGKDVYTVEGILFIRSQNILSGYHDFSDCVYIPEDVNQNMSRSNVQLNDVFLNITGASIGRSAVMDQSIQANVNQHVAILRCNDQLLPLYLSLFLNSKNGQSQIFGMQAGASREALNYSQIKQIKLPIPSVEVQKEIVVQIEKEQEMVNGNKQLIDIYEQKIKERIGEVWGE
jgi:type I restriction enzyme M protein